ncbi:uncharacterized protein CIMG_04334 [Coccidioides immitis RS]|uniref:Uncharacterized protein n=4 Tax=Coccidioides immitis TaxID=5501 RepID=J3KD97_COCIM|nr:uncharacterized protein CIMG_04334 [Coccidioides immitis RS]EAS33310.3 hypothetical protein CIMG_04334 [Coccidioides immitis RS]KMP04465.1 hypothetical protein CIRG_04147 [Coccidioides immitis RMSCC 2394]KMU76042.1 hypothetical protein CISG_05301 [Coccidioides immitis RMSCC 3703]KMU89987.1 hypothetical protein CIHG_07670 [Coccidioides immitis H538.4]
MKELGNPRYHCKYKRMRDRGTIPVKGGFYSYPLHMGLSLSPSLKLSWMHRSLPCNMAVTSRYDDGKIYNPDSNQGLSPGKDPGPRTSFLHLSIRVNLNQVLFSGLGPTDHCENCFVPGLSQDMPREIKRAFRNMAHSELSHTEVRAR